MNSPSFGDDRDWLLRFSPPEQTFALAALFQIEHEVMASLQPMLEHSVAHARLEWWQDELVRLARGTARHPACRALAAAANARGATPADLSALIEHVRVDLASVAFLTRDELDQHLANWAKSLFRELCLVSSAGQSAALRADGERLASLAGAAVRELELLSDFRAHARRGRIYTPIGATPDAHLCWSIEPLADAEITALAERRDALIRQLRVAATTVDASHRPALRSALLWIFFAIDNAQHAKSRRSALGRTWFAWRTALSISRGALPRT